MRLILALACAALLTLVLAQSYRSTVTAPKSDAALQSVARTSGGATTTQPPLVPGNGQPGSTNPATTAAGAGVSSTAMPPWSAPSPGSNSQPQVPEPSVPTTAAPPK